MLKKERKLIVYSAVSVQIFLLISVSFAISFIFSDNLVSAPGSSNPNPSASSSNPAARTGYEGPIGPSPPKDFFTKGSSYTSVKSFNEYATRNLPDGTSTGGKIGTAADGTTQYFYSNKGGIYKINADSSIGDKVGSGYYQSGPAGIFGTSNFFYGNLIQGVSWAIFVVGAIQLVGNLAGLDQKLTNSLSIAAGAGIIAGKAAYGLFGKGTSSTAQGIFGQSISPQAAFGIGLAVAAAIFILTYKKESKKLVNFQCLPFEPALGGQKCEQCNKDPFRPCSEYRCRSLGQACQLLNPGTKEEKCAWVNPKDVKSPVITLNANTLKPTDLKYIPDTAVRPPALGVKIVSSSAKGCLPAYTPLEFGFTTDEPSQCKIDYNHTGKIDLMQYYFGESNYYAYNHTQKMRLPGPNSADVDLSPLLRNDGSFALYTRCRDANGNENVDEYSFSFCVDESPDTTPPVIEGFSIPSGSYVTYNQDKVNIDAYVNEPAECRWSRESKSYEDMENSMQCAIQSNQINANLVYTCSGNLTGITNRADNKYYFRCKDNPEKPENERFAMVQSKGLILKGSQPLNIINAGPNETITGSTDVVSLNLEVETSNGAEEGKAICYFSPSNAQDSYIVMFETNNFKHKQALSLTNGNYQYFFRCIDKGGNAAEANTTFNVFVDKQAPRVTRAYKQDALKIVTDENAQCAYSLTTCNYNFDEGIKMSYINPDNQQSHFADWKPASIYYIKCRDGYGNLPDPNTCSIVVSAVELEKKSI